ncbi:glycosyltransferase [bacterium]|nr:glycosyltransferase [bacterium]
MKLSIIIPSYKRHKPLAALIKNLLASVTPWSFEIIIVFDQISDDAFDKFTTQFDLKISRKSLLKKSESDFEISIFSKDNLKIIKKEVKTGQGICRNIGLSISTGKYILFLDDDAMIPEGKSFLFNRISTFEKIDFKNKVSVGKINFPAGCSNINQETLHWDVAGIMDRFEGPELEFYQCLSCNLLGARNTFMKFQFDPLFKEYGYEDVELGFRLKKSGYKLFFDSTNYLYHLNMKNRIEFSKRFHMLGKNWILFEAIHPEVILESETVMGYLLFNRKFLFFEHEFKKTEIDGAAQFMKSLGIVIIFKSENSTFIYNPFQIESDKMSLLWYFSKNTSLTSPCFTRDHIRRIFLTAVLMKTNKKYSTIFAEDKSGILHNPSENTDNQIVSNTLNINYKTLPGMKNSVSLKEYFKRLRIYIREYTFFNNKIL